MNTKEQNECRAAFLKWAEDHLGQGYSLELDENTFIDPVTRWAEVAFRTNYKLIEQLAAEKRKTLELQRVYDERGLQIARLETALERANSKPILKPLTFDDRGY